DNFRLDDMSLIQSTGPISSLSGSAGLYGFVLDVEQVNGYFVRSCPLGKALVKVHIPTLTVFPPYIWDSDYIAVAQTPLITDRYLYYTTSQLTQTTEYLRFDLQSPGPNFTFTKTLSKFRYAPRVMSLDNALPQYSYVALDTAAHQMRI